MSEWRQKGFVQDSDEEEDESQLESQNSRQVARSNERVERVFEAAKQQEKQDVKTDGVGDAAEDAGNGAGALKEPSWAYEPDSVNHTPSRRSSPRRPTPSPCTPFTRSISREEFFESPDPLQSSQTLAQRSKRPPSPSQLLPSTLQRCSPEEIQLRPNAAISSPILGEVTKPTNEPPLYGNSENIKTSAILGEFGVAALSDDSEDELYQGQRSDAESILSDYPSDLSETEPRPGMLFATPHRRTAVQVVIPSSTALQHQLAEELRRRQFRERKPIQLHPYALEGERYRREVQSRGLKPVPRERSPQRRQVQNDAETQEEEFNPFRSCSSSPLDPEIFVSTPARQSRESMQPLSSIRRPRSNPPKRRLSANQLRLPKAAKKRRPNNSLNQALDTPARTSESSSVPRDIWSVPPNSPPYSSSPPINAQLGKLLSTINADSLPTPSNSSTFQDEPQLLPDSDSDPVSRSVQKSGGELRRPTRTVHNEDLSSDSDASSESEQVDGELQQVSKKIRGVLPASWLRIDQQAQERRQALARQRARLNATLSPEPAEPQRGVAQRVTRPVGHSVRPARPDTAPAGIVVISDDSDQDIEPSVYRQAHDAHKSVEDASALAAMFDDRYARFDDDLASMEYDRLQLPTLTGPDPKRKRQPKIADAFGHTKRTKSSTTVLKGSHFPKPVSGLSGRKTRTGYKKGRRTPPPALSVMDAELPLNVPEFLRLAIRAARRDVNQARQSPRRKQIRLHTAQDTEDANALLRQWQKGRLRPKIKPTIDRQQSERPPLVATTHNQQHTSRLNDLEKSVNEELGAGLMPMNSNSKSNFGPRVRKAVAPALQMLHRPSATVSKAARRTIVPRAFNSSESAIQRGPPPLRAAQLEGDEEDFGHSHRKIAFQKGLQHVNQQSSIQPTPKHSLNPQLARFLADDDAVLPPLPTAKEVGELRDEQLVEASATRLVPPSRKRLVRKSRAIRLDIDAREYRQPSEPVFETALVVPKSMSTDSASVEQHGDVLQGLGPFDTRYPTTFDTTPLKSDTYFHSDTFIGSEDFRRALSVSGHDTRNLDEHAGYCTVSHGSQTIRCGPWNDETYSRINDLITTIWPLPGEHHDQSKSETPLVTVMTSLSAVLRALALYFTSHLSFLDPIDRSDFTLKMYRLLQSLFDRVSTSSLDESEAQLLPGLVAYTNRVLSHLLVVSTQIHQIAQTPIVSDNEKSKLPKLIKDTSRLLVKDFVQRTQELYEFHDRNKLHKDRENGIQDKDTLVESVVICMHSLELLNTRSLGFWDLVGQELSASLPSARHIQTFERAWATIFSLLPFNEFDVSGIPDRSRTSSFDSDSWSCIREIMSQVLKRYEGTFRHNGSSANDYVRANLIRCYVLINDWHWRRPEQVLNVIFDFFGRQALKPLRRETTTGSAEFLQDFVAGSSLALASNESSFHVALKCLLKGLQGMNDTYPEKKIRSFVFRLVPNHGRTYPKDQPLEEESLAALRNHHDLLSALYCAAPPSCRPKLTLIRGLVSHENSHREACRVNVRAWANLTAFQLSTEEQYGAAKPFALWYKDIMYQTLKQYRLAKTEAEDYLKSGVLDGTTEVSTIMVRQAMEKNQEQVIATLRDSVAGMKKAIECARDQVCLAIFLTDSNIVHLFELPHLEDLRLLSVIRDTLVVFRKYAFLQKSQITHEESQPRSEESQDYGDFPDLDDLDDTEALQPVQTKTSSLPSRLDFVQAPLWHLMSNAFGAERSPDDNLLMDCVDTWVLIAGDQVMAGARQWSYYMDSFSQMSWQQLRQTKQTRKFGPYFMSALIACDPVAYEEHRHEFLTALLLSLADRESTLRFQYRLLDAIVRTDEGHPLLKNLPFFRTGQSRDLDITADTVRSRRLALISSLLSNMRDDVFAISVQEPTRTAEVKRSYAAMLKDFMARLKSNYQELQQGGRVTGAYVEFVQKIVQFLKQYTGDICPVLPFFTDSVAFPLPSTDPTYVVGRLCGYAPKAETPGIAKQLSVFIQTVAQQAAADNQQQYLVNQLTTSLRPEEAPVADRLALRKVLLQGIFPAYIEEAYSSPTGYLVAKPIMRCLPTMLDDMIFDLRVSQPSSLSTTIQNILSIAHSFIRGTEQLKGDSLLFQDSTTLSGLVYMLEAVTSILRLTDYLVDRTMHTTEHGRPPFVIYMEEFSGYIANMIEGTRIDKLPSYQGDAHVGTSSLKYVDILAFCQRGLRSSLETNWSEDQGSVWFGQGRAKKEVVLDIGSNEEERVRLKDALQRFQHTVRELSNNNPKGFGDDIVV